MANWSLLANSAGFGLTTIGVYIAYVASPINHSGIDGGNADTDFTVVERNTRRRNRGMHVGVCMVLLGSVLQFASNFLPEACASTSG